MFFVGVFSTHITYIILALIYIFGYGSYALNSKNNKENNLTECKSITYKKAIHSNNYKTFYIGKNSYQKVNNKKTDTHHISNVILGVKIHKYKVLDCKTWTSYNYLLPNTTRPSPYTV